MIKNTKLLRKENGITQKQLAEAIGVSQQSVNKYENHCAEPDLNTLVKIADFFDTSVDYLIGHSEVRRKIEVTHGCELNAEELTLIECYRRLSRKKKDCVLTVVSSYAD